MIDLGEIFSAGGPLGGTVRDFRPRPFQVEMARAVAEAIEGRSVLVAEAGTGTGKTFAYLVPALLSVLMLAAGSQLGLLLALVAVISAGAGVLVERWLFFAEAEHVSQRAVKQGPAERRLD